MVDIVPLALFTDNSCHDTVKCCVCKQRKHVSLFHQRIGWENDRWVVCKVCAEAGKHCSRCGKYQPFSAFPKQSGVNRGGVASYCKPCMLAYKRDYYKEHGKGKNQIQRERISAILSKYSMTEQDYQTLFASQEEKCAACGKPEHFHYQDGTLYRLAVDHDHRTGHVRGLLCRNCNLALGHLHDSPERIQALLDYLLSSE